MEISVCIIGKNEERVLEECLSALSVYDWEIVFTDTGSTDSTKEIAARYTDKIYDFEWNDDFSAARNFCASKASNDWIACIDCDEILQEFDVNKLESILQGGSNTIGVIVQKNPLKDMEMQEEYYVNCNQARIYNRTVCRYKYRVHEQLVPINARETLMVIETDVAVVHNGYIATGKELFEVKRRRNIMLLEKLIEECDAGETPLFYYQLGQAYNGYDSMKAIECFEASIAGTGLNKCGYLAQLVTEYGYLLIEMGMLEKALYMAWPYKELLEDYADYNYFMAVIFVKFKTYDKARVFLDKARCARKYMDIRTKTSLAEHYLQLIDKIVETDAAK